MLLQSIAGVPRKYIIEDYALSDQGMRRTAQDIVKRLTRNPKMPVPEDWATQLVLAKREYMKKLLRILDTDYGGLKNYKEQQMGFGEEELERIRQNLLVEEKPIYTLNKNSPSSWWEQRWFMLGVVTGCGVSAMVLWRRLLQRSH